MSAPKGWEWVRVWGGGAVVASVPDDPADRRFDRSQALTVWRRRITPPIPEGWRLGSTGMGIKIWLDRERDGQQTGMFTPEAIGLGGSWRDHATDMVIAWLLPLAIMEALELDRSRQTEPDLLDKRIATGHAKLKQEAHARVFFCPSCLSLADGPTCKHCGTTTNQGPPPPYDAEAERCSSCWAWAETGIANVRCCRIFGHGGKCLYKCASPICPGRDAGDPHPPNCGDTGTEQLERFEKGERW